MESIEALRLALSLLEGHVRLRKSMADLVRNPLVVVKVWAKPRYRKEDGTYEERPWPKCETGGCPGVLEHGPKCRRCGRVARSEYITVMCWQYMPLADMVGNVDTTTDPILAAVAKMRAEFGLTEPSDAPVGGDD